MNKEDLKKTTRLARLKLTEKETEEFTKQLQVVFDYFNQISRVKTDKTEPLVYPLEGIESPQSLREDKVDKTQNLEEFLSLAPERLSNEYKVPPVVE